MDRFLKGLCRNEGFDKCSYVKTMRIVYIEPTDNMPSRLGDVAETIAQIFQMCQDIRSLDLQHFLHNIISHKLKDSWIICGGVSHWA